jgi:uncharacterized membrane protein HdeD (DUF308 family)
MHEHKIGMNASARSVREIAVFFCICSLFAAACCGCNPAAAAASTVFFSLWIAAAAVQTAATVSACSQPNTPLVSEFVFSAVLGQLLVISWPCTLDAPW